MKVKSKSGGDGYQCKVEHQLCRKNQDDHKTLNKSHPMEKNGSVNGLFPAVGYNQHN